MTTQFGRVLIVDWSARSKPSPAGAANSIWLSVDGDPAKHFRTRGDAENWITAWLSSLHGERILAGFDFSFSYPQWFLDRLGLDWRSLWALLEREISDSDHQNNRFEVAARLNERASGGARPFWGTPRTSAFLSNRRPPLRDDEPQKRRAEPSRASSTFQLWGNGSVGSQTLLGLPVLERLRQRFGERISVWPFECTASEIVLAEVYPSLAGTQPSGDERVKDAWQVETLAQAFKSNGAVMEAPDCGDEGWILVPSRLD